MAKQYGIKWKDYKKANTLTSGDAITSGPALYTWNDGWTDPTPSNPVYLWTSPDGRARQYVKGIIIDPDF